VTKFLLQINPFQKSIALEVHLLANRSSQG